MARALAAGRNPWLSVVFLCGRLPVRTVTISLSATTLFSIVHARLQQSGSCLLRAAVFKDLVSSWNAQYASAAGESAKARHKHKPAKGKQHGVHPDKDVSHHTASPSSSSGLRDAGQNQQRQYETQDLQQELHGRHAQEQVPGAVKASQLVT